MYALKFDVAGNAHTLALMNIVKLKDMVSNILSLEKGTFFFPLLCIYSDYRRPGAMQDW